MHVKTGRFRKGDLVLLYTLKKNKRKLKMRGLGPFVINELSPSGAVRLENLDGEPMANFINGSRLKLYHEPLTEEMLQRMHQAHTRKAQAEQLRQDALKEAKERTLRTKALRSRIVTMPIALTENLRIEETVAPFFIDMELVVEKHAFTAHAFVDSGADVNVLSWDSWVALGKPGLISTNSQFVSFSQKKTQCLGHIWLKTRIQDEPMYLNFYVANKNQSLYDVVVSRHWMMVTKCHLDWESRQYTLQVNSRTLTGSSCHNKPPTTKNLHLSSTSQDNLPLHNCHSCRTQTKTTKRRTTTQQVWVPKKLLLAQGYDQGNKNLWIPKHPVKKNLISVPDPQPKSLSNMGHQLESTKIGAMLECQTGLVRPSSATVVKVNLSSPPVDPCLHKKLAPTLVQVPKQIFIPKASQYSIWDRANLLQTLLFGKASLLSSAIPPWHINPTNQSRAS